MAVASLWLPEPERGATDDHPVRGPRLGAGATLIRLFRTPAWRIDTVGITLTTFSVGGLAFWMPTFLVRTQHMSTDDAGLTLGGILVVSGLLGALLGGFLGDRAQARWHGGHLLVCAVVLLISAPVVAAMPFMPTRGLVLAFSFVGLFLLGVTIGPINAALVSCVPANLRSAAVAINNLVVHLLGDALSPFLLGWISEAASLRVAVSLTALPVVLAGGLLLSGGLRINRWPEGLRRYPG